MARLGMDADVVESVGKQLRQQGHQVTSVVRAVDALVSSADAHWWGARGRDFVHQWQSVHRPALIGAASSVDELSRNALRNVDEQRHASGRGQEAGNLPVGSETWQNLQRLIDMRAGYQNLDALNSLLEHGITQASAVAALVGAMATTARGTPYGALYKRVFGGSDFMHYNRSLQHLYSPAVRRILDSPALRGADLFGRGLTLVNEGTDLYKTFWDPGHAGGATMGEKIEVGGSALGSTLKMSKNPVAYLAGAGVTAWSMVGAEATKTDWSAEGTKQTWDYIGSNPNVVVEEFGKAAKDMFTNRIWKILG